MSFKSMFEKLNNDRLAGGILFAGAMISIIWAVYFSVVTISMPYQIELREGTAMVTTKILLGGGNPYVFEYQPLGLNVYGIVYSLTVLPFAFLFGNTLLVHRTVTLVFILLSTVLVAATVYKTRRDFSLALGCGAFVMVGLTGRGGIGAFPAAMGSFLFLAAVLIPFLRSFRWLGLFVSALLAIVAFYTKPYFVLAFSVVVVYLFLFVSKKKSILYSLLFLPLFMTSCVIVRVVFPLYFMNVLVGNIFLTVKSTETLVQNLVNLFLSFYPVLTIAFVVGIQKIVASKKKVSVGSGAQTFWGVGNLDHPLISKPANYLLCSFAGSLLAFILILGSHGGGTGMNYAYQLITPLFFAWLFTELEFGGQIRLAVVVAMLFNLFVWEQAILNPVMLRQRDSAAWSELFDRIESSSGVLNSQVVVSKVIEIGKVPTDSGQTIIFYQIRPFPENVLLGPSYDAIRMDGMQYTTAIDRAIEKQRFDLVITTEEKASFFHAKRLPLYYSVAEELVVDMPQTGQSWTVLLWKPIVK